MKIIIILFFFVFSCGYPDIDSIPDVKNLALSKQESIDLCKLVNTDNNDILECIKKIKK